MFKVFNRCLTSRTSRHDQTKINILQIFHAVINRVHVDYAGLLWWDFLHCVQQKKDVIQYPRFTKLIIADLMKKFASIPQRLEEDYHSIKDDIPLVSVYTKGNVTVKRMLIPDDLLTDLIRETQEYKDYVKEFIRVEVPTIQPQPVESTQGANRTPRSPRTLNPVTTVVDDVVFEKKKGKRVAGETSSPRPSLKIPTLLSVTMHKTTKAVEEQENVAIVQEKLLEEDINKMVDRDDDSDATKFDDSVYLNDEEDISDKLEPESHKDKPKIVDDGDEEEEKKDDKKDDDNDDNDHTDHASIKDQVMGSSEIRQEKMHALIPSPLRSPRIDLSSDKDINQKLTATVSLTPATSSKVHSKPSTSKRIILPGSIARMAKRHSQLRKKLRNTFVINTHFQEKKAGMSSQITNRIPELTVPKTNELIKEALPRLVIDAVKQEIKSSRAAVSGLISQEFAKQVPKIIEELFKIHMRNTVLNMQTDLHSQVVDPELRKILRVKFEKSSISAGTSKTDAFRKDAEEYAYHIRQSKLYALVFYGPQRNPNEPPRYLYNKDLFFLEVWKYQGEEIVEVVRVTTEQQHGLDFMEQIILMRENNKPDSFSEADFKYLNIEDMYYLCMNKKVNYRKNKLLNSLMTFIGNKPDTNLINLNSKGEKRVMNLVEIVKFCDATLERVLKKVKLKIFEIEFLKKAPLLGELDLDIMKAYEKEITKRLRHRGQMRRWESFVNGRPILPTMKRQ
ncbi:hypothetical protein Tco_0650848 [Tanacetum coccineum]